MDGIDQAALRRFDIKAKFGFLSPEQASELLRRHSASEGLGEPSAELRFRLGRLANLTPGDFAVIARRQRFERFEDASAWLAALEAECALKEGGKTRIGF